MHHIARSSFICVALIAMGACKQSASNDSSDAKTLDSFAAGQKIRTNECRVAEDAADAGGRFNSAKYPAAARFQPRILVQVTDPSKNDALINEVLIALTSVPAFSQDLFEKMDGVVRITPDAAKLCGRFLADQNGPNYADQSVRDTIESCSILAERPRSGGGTERSLTLVINSDLDSVRHGVVRGFGYLHAQFFPRMRRNLAGGDQLFVLDATDTPGILAVKDNLARMFFRDMIKSDQSNGVFRIAGLQRLLGQSTDGRTAAAVIQSNLSKSGTDLFAGMSLTYPGESRDLAPFERNARAQNIRDFIAAEGYDSMFCRPQGAYSDATAQAARGPADLIALTNTTKVLQHFFPETFSYYSDTYVPALRSQSQDLMATISGAPSSASVPSGSNSGLALTGTNDLMALIAALLGAQNAGVQAQGAAAKLPGGVSAFVNPPSTNPNGQPNNGGGQVLGNNSNGGSGSNCPCGCGGPPCNCQGGGCCGGNCPCCGGGGGGVEDV